MVKKIKTLLITQLLIYGLIMTASGAVDQLGAQKSWVHTSYPGHTLKHRTYFGIFVIELQG